MSETEAHAFLLKAQKFLKASEALLAGGFHEDAASSAYYAMFTKSVAGNYFPKFQVTVGEVASSRNW